MAAPDPDDVEIIFEKNYESLRDELKDWFNKFRVPMVAFCGIYNILKAHALGGLELEPEYYITGGERETPPKIYTDQERREIALKNIRDQEMAIQQLQESIADLKRTVAMIPGPPPRQVAQNLSIAPTVPMPLCAKMRIVYDMMPVSTIQKFKELNLYFQDPAIRQRYITNKTARGVLSIRETVYEILPLIFTNEVGKHYSWANHPQKLRMDTTHVGTAIIEIFRILYKGQRISMKHVDKHLRRYVAYSEQRLNKGPKKQKKN